MTGFPNQNSRQRGAKNGLDENKLVRNALLWLAVLLAAASAMGLWILVQTRVVLVFGVTTLLLWSFLAVLIQYLYRLNRPDFDKQAAPEIVPKPRTIFGRLARHVRIHFASLWQWVLLLAGVVSALCYLLPQVRWLQELNQAALSPNTFRFAAVTILVIGCVLYLYANYIHALQKRLNNAALPPVLHLAWTVFAASAASSGILFLFLSLNYDYGCWLGWPLTGLSVILAIEPFILYAGRFYQPVALRKIPAPAGASVLLDMLFGSGLLAKGIIKEMEELVGMKVGEIWILQFLYETIESVLVIGIIAGWLSTCISSVPLGNRGVLISLGRYREPVLEPGLHVTWPWPFEQIQIIDTGRIRDISLGFEKDLSRPLLWTQKHVEGEKNLLVGDGENLLTINVPVYYRIADPISYLKTTIDAETALKSLAERKLIQITAQREAFHVMIQDRQQIADTLKQVLQSEVDRLGMGLEITFVGLKDIHPPVDVAPAYQNVISAQEQKDAMINDALAYEARTLPQANSQAFTLVTAADANYTKRVDQSAGESAHFESLVAGERAASSLFRLRLRYDALDETLARPAKTIVAIPGQNASEYFLDLRTNTGSRSGEVPTP